MCPESIGDTIMPATTSPGTLRIDFSMRYNAINGQYLPIKAARVGGANTYTNLTQPAGAAEDWAGIDYTKPHSRPGGISIGALCVCRAGLRAGRLTNGGIMTAQTQNITVPRSYVVTALTRLREEWQEAADGESLIDVDGNVALLLADVAMSIGLSTVEQVQVLGHELAQELCK